MCPPVNAPPRHGATASAARRPRTPGRAGGVRNKKWCGSALLALQSERGIALLIVVSLLTVIGIMGVAFAFSMYLETQATHQFVSTTQARYLAEAGVSHARLLLDEDRLGSRTDDPSESWAHETTGSDVDVDGDGTADAKWWLVSDPKTTMVGRYALKLSDEAGKANLNVAQADPSPLGLGAINLTTLLEEAGISRAEEAAQAIKRYRYGDDEGPGKSGIDDDGDGAIDEEDEYQPLTPHGDDRMLQGLEELSAIVGLRSDEIHALSRVATVYSWDLNVSVRGKTRVNINTAPAAELLEVLLEAGVGGDPWKTAANMADYVDPDFEISRVTKSSQLLLVPNQGSRGGWTWQDDSGGYYASEASGDALSWSAQVPEGTFRILVKGFNGEKVGDVTVGGQLKPSVDDGESLGLFQLSGPLTIEVVNRESAPPPCAFRGIELVPETAETGVVVRGIEAVRFNELMVDPSMTMEVSSATFDPQGSDWGCPGRSVCSNSGVGQARWVWTNPLLEPGRYYVRVFGSSPGQTVGEVRIEGSAKLLVHGQTHPTPVTVGSDGKITLTIGKTNAEQTYYVKNIVVSVQPDAEYIELINLSGYSVDVSGWAIEGTLTGGREAKLPPGSVIKPHGLLVAAVDVDDTQTGMSGNGIDARLVWEIPDEVTAAQLQFPGGPPSPDDDWLKTTLPEGIGGRLTLRSGTIVVDEIEYPLPLPTTATFQSLEKGDPSSIVDQDQDGVDEGWYPSLQLYTPGQPNDNEGLKELVGLETIAHDPSKEVTVLNRPLGGVGELAGLASGTPWKVFSSADLAKIVDQLTVEGHHLEAEGHWAGAEGEAAWEEKAQGYYLHTDPAQSDVVGRWQWSALQDGVYRVRLYSCGGCLGEQISVRWELKDQAWTDWSPALSTDAQGRVVIGQVEIGMEGTPTHTLTLELACASQSGICHFDYVSLDPQLVRIGPVNVNTAPREVLLALPGMTDALASRIMTNRPYGDNGEKGRGIGDLLSGDVLGTDEGGKLATFRQLAHLLTIRSDVFEILSLAQAMTNKRVEATQRIQAVVQR